MKKVKDMENGITKVGEFSGSSSHQALNFEDFCKASKISVNFEGSWCWARAFNVYKLLKNSVKSFSNFSFCLKNNAFVSSSVT